MRNKRSGFFTLCVSLVPGAGEMYMGLYKQGISLMSAFWGIIFIGSWAGLEVFFAALPVIWCYSFFRTHNFRNMSEEEFLLQEDRFLICNDIDFVGIEDMMKSHRKLVAGILIFLGVCMLGQISLNVFRPLLEDFLGGLFWHISHYAAKFCVGVVIIASGIYMLKNGKEQMAKQGVEK